MAGGRGLFEGEAGAGSQKMEPGWEGEREGNAFLSALQWFWPPALTATQEMNDANSPAVGETWPCPLPFTVDKMHSH